MYSKNACTVLWACESYFSIAFASKTVSIGSTSNCTPFCFNSSATRTPQKEKKSLTEVAPPQAPEPITESKPSGRPRKAGGLFYSNAEIAEIATSGKALPPEIKAWAKEIGWDKFNAIVEKGSGSLALSDDAPKINCSFTNVESDPRDDDGTAIAQMIEINDLLDTVRADDPDDMSLVDRVKGLIEAKTPVERSQLSAAIDAELLVPAPVMADLLGMFMRNLGDPRYQQISGTRIAGGHRWETAYREGLFVGEVTRNWTLMLVLGHLLPTPVRMQ
jgi:hypothetical protein